LTKKIIGLILPFILVAIITIPAFANANRLRQDSQEAGDLLGGVIELIMERYAGKSVTVDELRDAALRGMASILDDYSIFLNEEEVIEFSNNLTGRTIGIGISMVANYNGQIIISRVFPNSPAHQAGVQAGDFLMTIDGEPIILLAREEVSAIITNPTNPRVIIGVEREGLMHTFDILKAEIVIPTVTVSRLENLQEAAGLPNLEDFRIMQISSVGRNTADDVRQELLNMQQQNVRGLIIDLRSNQGGYLDITTEIANMLVPSGPVFHTVDINNRRNTQYSTLEEVPFEHMIVLINRFTASAAEVIASAMQDSDAAIIVGEQSYGKGLVQSVYTMADVGHLHLTTEIFYRRSGEAINNIGVIPNIFVQQSHIFGGQDDVLRRALEEITSNR